VSFEVVLAELTALTRAVNRSRPDASKPDHRIAPFITDVDIQHWAASTGLTRSGLYDRIAIWLARGFHRFELEFEFCDH
jgi:hypothetical protein